MRGICFPVKIKVPAPIRSEIPHPHVHALPAPLLLAGDTVQPVGECGHEILREPVGTRIGYAVAGDGAADVGGLFEDVIPGEAQESVLLLEEGLLEGSVEERVIPVDLRRPVRSSCLRHLGCRLRRRHCC